MSYVVYAHRFVDEVHPFFVGSGSRGRAEVLDPRPSTWTEYVGNRIADVVVEILEEHECEGQARFREAELIGANNPPANYIAAIRSASDLLTGRRKGGKPCECGTAECRWVAWKSMSAAEQALEITAHRARIDVNRTARNLSKVKHRRGEKTLEAQKREHNNVASRDRSPLPLMTVGNLTKGRRNAYAELLAAEVEGRVPNLGPQQRGSAMRALESVEGLSTAAAKARVDRAFP